MVEVGGHGSDRLLVWLGDDHSIQGKLQKPIKQSVWFIGKSTIGAPNTYSSHGMTLEEAEEYMIGRNPGHLNKNLTILFRSGWSVAHSNGEALPERTLRDRKPQRFHMVVIPFPYNLSR